MNQPMGMQVARPIQAIGRNYQASPFEKLQNRNRFLSMFSPQTRPLEPQDGPALATPEYFPMIPGGEELVRKQKEQQKLQNIFGINSPGGISSLAQMLPRAT